MCFAIAKVRFSFALMLATAAGTSSAAAQGVSPLCTVFDNKSAAHRTTVLVQQVKPASGTPESAAYLAKFKFRDTLQSIISGAKLTTPQSPEDLIRTMFESFRTTPGEERQPESRLAMQVDARPEEAKLDPQKLFEAAHRDEMLPVGFFNRPDLASLQSGNCGEARIVYAKRPGPGTPPAIGRLLIIFEGKVTPVAGDNAQLTPADCRPVDEFWASLVTKPAADRPELLRRFFFEGDLDGRKPLARPPMSFENLGGSNRGQVRGNLFVTLNWQLREWLLRKHGDRLAFDVVTVKDNPLPEFYDLAKAATLLEPVRGAVETRTFQSTFISTMMQSLSKNDLPPEQMGPAVAALPPEVRLHHAFGFGPGVTTPFDEFQSTSQALGDIPVLDTAFSDKVKLAAGAAGLTPAHIISRVTALTCQGCHQPEGATRPNLKLEIAPLAIWPKNQLNFVHIDENSEISDALRDSFLPFRAALLKDRLCADLKPDQSAEAESLARFARKSAPAPFAPYASLPQLRELLENATSEPQAAVAQEAINREQITRRRSERSLPGTFWEMRRTH